MLVACASMALLTGCQGGGGAVQATGHRMRIDLRWHGQEPDLYEIWRGDRAEGPFERIADQHGVPLYTDFVGQDGISRYYRVRTVKPSTGTGDGSEFGAFSATVEGRSVAEDREAFLTGVQEAGIRYFFDFAHPVSGLAREWGRQTPPRHVRRICAIGASGMGLMNLVVGLERGVLPAVETRELLLRMLTFVQEQAETYDGALPHWMDGTTGKTIPFAKIGGADIVETAFFMEGVLVVREYFSGANKLDRQIRSRADELWRGVRWDRFTDEKNRLYWHWPVEGLKRPMRITGSNEGHIAYLLAVASPTHPAPDEVYSQGWVGTHRVMNKAFYGMHLEVGRPHGSPLFWTHYSYLGLDPHGLQDKHVTDYFTYHRNVALIHWEYAKENPKAHAGYGPLRWGLTSSSGPDGYGPWTPVRHDNGTIAPTAALSSMPYVPEQSLAMLEDLYEKRGGHLWGEFGFYDAFNDSRNWVSKGFWIGIDVGPIAPMIENHRTGLCWKLFMNAPEIKAAVERLGIAEK
jgi:hypothetical protein